MKAIAVIPGTPESIHLRDIPKPGIEEIKGGRGVLVKVLRVGVDGTDKEINAAEYGKPHADRFAADEEGFLSRRSRRRFVPRCHTFDFPKDRKRDFPVSRRNGGNIPLGVSG
ncbi:MAG: hypothetical protein WBX49_07455 [Candidatus Deferrimicrobiaceae bacterium]